MDSVRSSKKDRFFSLKWKAVLLLSLILVAVNASLATFSYLQLKSQFEQNREQVQSRQWVELQGMLLDGYRRMQQFASLIPILESGTVLSKEFSSHLQSIFDEHASIMQLDLGIATARFYTPTGKAVFSWQPLKESRYQKGWIRDAIDSEKPVMALDCSGECIQYVAYPLLADGELGGILLLGQSVADAVLGFQRLTGADLAVVTGSEAGVTSRPEKTHILREWDVRVAAITSSEHSLPLLKAVSENFEISRLRSSSVLFKHAGRSYELRANPFSLEGEEISVYMLIINDVSMVLKEIRSATATSITMGLAGLLVSEVILLLLLWAPLERLKRMAQALPLLARHSFDEAREIVGSQKNLWMGKDEIDIAGETAITLSRELERLDKEVGRSTTALQKQRDNLARERDFVTGLLNTAQVVILTLDRDGKILSVNRFGTEVTQFYEDEIKGKAFLSLLVPESGDKPVRHEMALLQAGNRDHYRHESHVLTQTGDSLTISWFHSRLTEYSEQDATVLSVGLDITQREEAKRELAWLADHDPLTKLCNRRHFQAEFRRILEMEERYGHGGALLFIDLDHFKLVNDTSGHQAGDILLRMVAKKMLHLVRTTDLLARLGGDEFALVIPEINQEEAIKVAQKLIAALEQIELPVQDRIHHISASIGIVIFPTHGSDMLDLMANADLAMYQAKEHGRGCWHLFSVDERARERMDARVQWKRKIGLALEEDRFVLHFQPILDIRRGTVSHYEVLLRMVEQDGTIVFPGAFIPEAELTGMIHNIDRMVLRKAILELEKYHFDGRAPKFSVNLSGSVVDDPELLPLLKDLLQMSGVNPEQLVFEVTETAAVADITAAEKLMREIQDLGCRFALDDFGVGFSSFYYLKQLPVDIVKIDGTFIRQLPNNHDDQVFVKALTEVAKGLGKKTVAEFVEDAATLELLRDYGVDYAQGYYIGRPSQEIAGVSTPST